MWSYPNMIPLSAAKVRRIAEILEPLAFDAVYGAFAGRGQIEQMASRWSRRRSSARSRGSARNSICRERSVCLSITSGSMQGADSTHCCHVLIRAVAMSSIVWAGSTVAVIWKVFRPAAASMWQLSSRRVFFADITQ